MDKISEKLSSLVNNESISNGSYSGYDLSSIRGLLSLAGNPQSKGNYAHIAGTNGKGSVAWMLAAILQQRGLSTGLYTSPHLLTVNERIRINFQTIPDDILEAYLDELISRLNNSEMTPTWFDAVTWTALCYFRDQKVDMAVIETGLGGRLDSTNVITPGVTILTEIAIDHRAVLGDTLGKISSEKAGIIKKGVPVINSRGSKEVLNVIMHHASDAGAPLLQEGVDFDVTLIRSNMEGTLFNYSCDSPLTGCMEISDIFLPINCPVQARNAGFAITAARVLDTTGRNDHVDEVRDALKSISIPGRFEKLRDDPPVIFDPAHNPPAVKEVIGSIVSSYADQPISVVLSIMNDKDYIHIMSLLKDPAIENIFYFVLDDQRCYQPSVKEQYQFHHMTIIHTQDTLFRSLRSIGGSGNVILFLGSFRLYKTATEFALLN